MENTEPQNPAAGKHTTITITGNKETIINIGSHNLIQVSVKLREVTEAEVNADTKNWRDVLAEMERLQQEIKQLDDRYEELRDIELVPTVAQAKAAAKEITENPKTPKKSFIEKLARISEVAGKVVEVGSKVSPFIVAIGKLLGINI